MPKQFGILLYWHANVALTYMCPCFYMSVSMHWPAFVQSNSMCLIESKCVLLLWPLRQICSIVNARPGRPPPPVQAHSTGSQTIKCPLTSQGQRWSYVLDGRLDVQGGLVWWHGLSSPAGMVGMWGRRRPIVLAPPEQLHVSEGHTVFEGQRAPLIAMRGRLHVIREYWLQCGLLLLFYVFLEFYKMWPWT